MNASKLGDKSCILEKRGKVPGKVFTGGRKPRTLEALKYGFLSLSTIEAVSSEAAERQRADGRRSAELKTSKPHWVTLLPMCHEWTRISKP